MREVVGSSPTVSTTSGQALLVPIFCCTKNQSPAPLSLLFRKRSRQTARLACKRTCCRFIAYQPFSGCACGAKYLFWSNFPRRSKLRCNQNAHSLSGHFSYAPLLLLFRKKAHARRIFACKRAHNAFGSLPSFCDMRLRFVGCRFFSPKSHRPFRNPNVAIRVSKCFRSTTPRQALWLAAVFIFLSISCRIDRQQRRRSRQPLLF